jgi:retron-type reverse transcriptase
MVYLVLSKGFSLKWPALDRFIQCDVVKCFDNIDHELLLSFLMKQLGHENKGLVDLIDSFLKSPIYAPGGKTYVNTEQGIPQERPISLVLMNCFLHHLDMEVEKGMLRGGGTPVFYYARYADDLVFGIPRGEESTEVVTLLKETLARTCSD